VWHAPIVPCEGHGNGLRIADLTASPRRG
jgi:hypothetical protein